MVEVRDGFVVKDENTETNGIRIQPNKMQGTEMQMAIDYRDAKKEFSATNSLGMLLKMHEATHG